MIKFLSSLPYWLLIVLSMCSVVLGDYFAKVWSLNPSTKFFILTVLTYGLSGVFFTPTLLKHGLVYGSVLWTVGSTLGFLLIGALVFNETFGIAQAIGVTFGVLSLIVLSFF